jgi:hypothetical protein
VQGQIEILIRARLKLLRLYRPTPEGCSCGNAHCKSIGKHPVAGVYAGRQYGNYRCFDKHNVGVCTGEGLVVLDIDPRNGGMQTLAQYVYAYGSLPDTWTVRTGSGGWHYYFKGQCKSFTLEGIDVQSTGKMVVAPPSVHASGNIYEWIISPDDIPLAPIPEWVINLAPPDYVPSDSDVEYSDDSIVSALHAINPNCNYVQWNKIGMALYNGGFKYEIFRRWSAASATKYDEAECARKWAQYRKAKTISVTPATIIYLANKAGWCEFDKSLVDCFG